MTPKIARHFAVSGRICGDQKKTTDLAESVANDSGVALCKRILVVALSGRIYFSRCLRITHGSTNSRDADKLGSEKMAAVNVSKQKLSGVFHRLPETTKPTASRPLLSLYGIIYVTWCTSNLSEATGVGLRLPNSHALLGSGRRWKTLL